MSETTVDADELRAAIARLEEGRERLSDRSRWIKGDYSEIVNGRNCYCAMGAVKYHLTEGAVDLSAEAEPPYARALIEALPVKWVDAGDRAKADAGAVINFNDHSDTTHADVLALFDRAIANLKEKLK